MAVRLDEGIERRVGVALQAEHGVQAALGVGVQQGKGVVAEVIDDDVAGGEGVEMQPGGTALVSVGVQAEVDRQAGVQAVQATEQALRVVGRRGGCAVAQPQAVGRIRGAFGEGGPRAGRESMERARVPHHRCQHQLARAEPDAGSHDPSQRALEAGIVSDPLGYVILGAILGLYVGWLLRQGEPRT